jgi:hypothetical protein
MDPTHTLFAVLTLIAAPAVLTNASSVLGLNTANRFGRVIDRSRQLSLEVGKLPHGSALSKLRQLQLARLYQRGQYLLRAQVCIYLALGLFVATALVAVIGAVLAATSALGYETLALVALFVGFCAAISLLFGCILIVQETRIALTGMYKEIEYFEKAMPADVEGIESLSPL